MSATTAGQRRSPHVAWASVAWAAAVIREEQWATAYGKRSPWRAALYEFVRFGAKMAWACLFGALMLVLLLATWLWYPAEAPLARYDFLTLAAVAIQIALLKSGLETREEARVIAAYHLAGTLLEWVLTARGFWTYPEASVLRIGNVPLFSGFMYAAIGSFMVRAWHLFDFRFERHPPLHLLTALAAAIYVAFVSHGTAFDLRLPLCALAALVFAPCTIHYRIWKAHRQMPLLLAALLTAVFIFIAENIGTLANAWVYPYQRAGWRGVSFKIYYSWFLLLIVSYTLVVTFMTDAVRAPDATAPTNKDGATKAAPSNVQPIS